MRRMAAGAIRAERAQPGTSLSLPAPVGGLNTRDPIDQMAPVDAVHMENWFPDSDAVRMRPGHSVKCNTEETNAVETLLAWESGPASKLLAAVNGGIQNVTTATASSVVTAATYTNDRFQWVNAGGYLIACNGANSPWHYNASGLSNTGFTGTGLSVSDLIAVDLYKSRLYFIEKDTPHFWYGSVGAVVSGTLTKFDLGQIARRGGNLQALGSWSTRTGDTLSEFIAFIMDTGETLVYSGSDPGNDFALVQRVETGRPIGRRCVAKVDSDLVVITEQGFVPLSFLIAGYTADQLQTSVMYGKIRRAAQSAAAAHKDNFGWQVFYSASGKELYINVPRAEGVHYTQYVMNTVTGAWTEYTGWNARCFAKLLGKDYWGAGNGVVNEVGGQSDDGADIIASCRTAFSYLGDRGSRKRITAVRPVVTTDGQFIATLGVDMDFSERAFAADNVNIGQFTTGAVWDESEWGEDEWADAAQPNLSWVSVTGIGRAAAVRFDMRAQSQNVSWYSTDLLGQRGSVR